MGITVAQYIASENLQGVQELAKRLGDKVPRNSQEGYMFLKYIYLKDSVMGDKYFAEIHPDRDILATVVEEKYNNMTAEPMYKNACGSCGSFSNATGCNCGGGGSMNMRNATDEVISQLSSYSDKGLYETEKAVNSGIDKMRELLKEKDDRLFKYLAVFAAGYLLHKLISK